MKLVFRGDVFGLILVATLTVTGCGESQSKQIVVPKKKPIVGLATDDDLSAEPGDSERRQLSVYGLEVTDQGIAELARFPGLRVVDLNFTSITDEGLQHLAKLESLKTLDLRGCYRVTDAGLESLAGLKNLTKLNLTKLNLTFTRVTDEGVRRLQEKLPELHIYRAFAASETGDNDELFFNASRLGASNETPSAYASWKRRCDKDDWIGRSIAMLHIIQSRPDDASLFDDVSYDKELNKYKGWEWLAHNLSYNIPVEFDDARDRYFWTRQGIEALVHAAKRFPKQASLLHQTGWFIGHKIGNSDDYKEARQFFREDESLHVFLGQYIDLEKTIGFDGKPDNWLTAGQWFSKSADAADLGASLNGKSPLIFFADPAMARINYAQAIREDGATDEQVKAAWKVALRAWNIYGYRRIPMDNEEIRLNDLSKYKKEIDQQWAQLIALTPGLTREELSRRKREALTDEEKAALKQYELSGGYQEKIVFEARRKIEVSANDFVEHVAKGKRDAAASLAKRIADTEKTADRISRSRAIVAYAYWQTRCKVEQTDEMATAHQLTSEAVEQAKQPDAAERFEVAFKKWSQILSQHPKLKSSGMNDDLNGALRIYRRDVLKGNPFPDGFPLLKYAIEEEAYMEMRPPKVESDRE